MFYKNYYNFSLTVFKTDWLSGSGLWSPMRSLSNWGSGHPWTGALVTSEVTVKLGLRSPLSWGSGHSWARCWSSLNWDSGHQWGPCQAGALVTPQLKHFAWCLPQSLSIFCIFNQSFNITWRKKPCARVHGCVLAEWSQFCKTVIWVRFCCHLNCVLYWNILLKRTGP